MIHNNIYSAYRTSSRRGSKIFRVIGWTAVGLCVAALFALVFGFIVKWLWNWLMPALFGLGVITYWQAFGIVLLAKLLFGGFGGHHKSDRDRFGSRIHDKRHNFFGDDGEDWNPEEEWKYNRHYRKFWREEGKMAFDNYLQRVESQEGEKEEE